MIGFNHDLPVVDDLRDTGKNLFPMLFKNMRDSIAIFAVKTIRNYIDKEDFNEELKILEL